ncbi:hypothetical protein KC906_01695 [Candidatus Kaiserbacteria bacterium]|nr:hypothetical protein [Candidatus Kaiserbacteria bacterium]
MTGVFRDILMRHFADPDLIEEPDLRKLIWKPGQDTGILLESSTRWRPELTQFRPGVILKRNAYANVRKGIDDRRQGPADILGNDHHVTYWTGSHTLFCIARTGAQVELLGSEVQRELTQFGPAMREVLALLKFRVTELGAIAKLEESQENWVVPVTVGYAYEERWVIRPEAPRLSHLSLSLINEC